MVAELLPTSNWEGAVESGPIKKAQGKMRSRDLERTDSQRKMKEKVKGKGNLLGPAGMGVVGMVETSTVGTAETGAEGRAGMGATSMARVGIPMSAAIPSPSKVSANEEIDIQMKGSNEQCKYI